MTLLDQLTADVDQLYASGRFRDRRELEAAVAALLVLTKNLDPETEREVLRHADELGAQLSISLTSIENVRTAERICMEAADRLRRADWFNVVVQTWPTPIAHEVGQLVAILGGEHRPPSAEAALLQLRDVSDVLIKLPTLVFVRNLIERGGEDARFARGRMLQKILHGGDWMSAARALAAREQPQAFARLRKLFDSSHAFQRAMNALITARNDYLGHAALRSDPAETASIVAWYAAGVPSSTIRLDRTSGLWEGLAAAVAAEPWSELRLEALDGDTVIELTGARAVTMWEATLRHDHGGRALPVRLMTVDGQELAMAPYVAARICRQCDGRDIFLFDTIKELKSKKVDFQDYAHGHKSRLSDVDAPDMGRELVALPSAAILPSDDISASLDAGSTIARLDRARVEHTYLSPDYLRVGLKQFIENADRGIYWLRAPAHIGKTTFVQGLVLPQLAERAIVRGLAPGRGGAIASYFCKKEYREGRVSFLNGLAATLQEALDIRDDATVLKPDPRNVLGAGDKQAAFVKWIDGWRHIAKQPEQRLLVVVDGLDEADDPASGDSVVDLLPRPSDLPTGLYFLLTSRRLSDSDCPVWLAPALDRLYPHLEGVSGREVQLDDPDYVSLLCSYAARALGRQPQEATFERLFATILEKSESRFVYVSFLIEQLRAGRLTTDELATIGSGDEIYERFLDRLEERYGIKRADDIRLVLATLAAEETAHTWMFAAGAQPDLATGGILEPIDPIWQGSSLDLLAGATGLDVPSPEMGERRYNARLVETLLLIQGALGVWRGETGAARYRLGLKGFTTILAANPETRPLISRAHGRLATQTLDAVEAIVDAIKAGEKPPQHELALFTQGATRLAGHVKLANSEPLQHRFQVAQLEIPMTICLDLAEARAAFRAYGQWNALYAFWLQSNVVETVRREIGCRLLPQLFRCEDAVNVPKARLRDALGSAWPPEWANNLAKSYMNRAIGRISAPGYDPQTILADLDAAIRLMEQFAKELGETQDWPFEWAYDLAKARNNRAAVYNGSRGFFASGGIEDLDLAISILNSLITQSGDQWSPAWFFELANALDNRAISRRQMAVHDVAAVMADHDEAIAILEALEDKLKSEWPADWAHRLALAYAARADAKTDSPGYGPTSACADFDKSIALAERLRKQLGAKWPLPWTHRLASTYTHRATAKMKGGQNGTAEAIVDYGKAIELLTSLVTMLGKDCPPGWENDLGSALLGRGNASFVSGERGAAQSDYDAAISLMEDLRIRLNRNWSFSWAMDLAKAYMNRAAIKTKDFSAAMSDNEASIKLMSEMRELMANEWPHDWAQELAKAVANRGATRMSAVPLDPIATIADFDVAIKDMERIRENLGKDWPPRWGDELAKAYLGRARTKASTRDWGAIADLDHAIQRMEDARQSFGAAWPLDWAKQLASTYSLRAQYRQEIEGRDTTAVLADFNMAAELGEFLRQTLGRDLPANWAEDLASAYMLRAEAREGSGADNLIAADYTAAISIFAALYYSVPGPIRPDRYRELLFKLHFNRALAHLRMQDRKKACADIQQSLLLGHELAALEPAGRWGELLARATVLQQAACSPNVRS